MNSITGISTFPPTRLKGSALLSVIVISLVIFLTIGCLYLLLGQQQRLMERAIRDEQLERNLRSVLAIILSDGDMADGERRALDLYGQERDSAWMKRTGWGIYEAIAYGAHRQGDSLAREAILGNEWPVEKRFALYLADDDRPLSVSGRTRIIGNAFLPPAGIRKAYIENQAFMGDEVVQGDTKPSQREPTALDGPTVASLQQQFAYDSISRTLAGENRLSAAGDSLHVPFYMPTKHLFLPDSGSLDNIFLSGNIIVHGQGALHIASTARLEHVLLFASSITLQKGFGGCIQAFARDSLVVGEDCQLSYPSALGLLVPTGPAVGSEHVPFIRLAKNTQVQGTVFSLSPPRNHILQSQLFLYEGSKVEGEVHADGYLESRGTVIGATTCRRFSLRTSATLYDNFIINTTMDSRTLPSHYLSSGLTHGQNKKHIAKWIP